MDLYYFNFVTKDEQLTIDKIYANCQERESKHREDEMIDGMVTEYVACYKKDLELSLEAKDLSLELEAKDLVLDLEAKDLDLEAKDLSLDLEAKDLSLDLEAKDLLLQKITKKVYEEVPPNNADDTGYCFNDDIPI